MVRRIYIAYLVPVLFAVALLSGCAARVSYRTYDPYYHDYHVWTDAERPYYNMWIGETHRPHLDYRHLRERDRQDYWRWRHDHH